MAQCECISVAGAPRSVEFSAAMAQQWSDADEQKLQDMFAKKIASVSAGTGSVL